MAKLLNLHDFRIELVGETKGYIYHCEARNVGEAIKEAITYHNIKEEDVITIYVTEKYWSKVTKEDFE